MPTSDPPVRTVARALRAGELALQSGHSEVAIRRFREVRQAVSPLFAADALRGVMSAQHLQGGSRREMARTLEVTRRAYELAERTAEMTDDPVARQEARRGRVSCGLVEVDLLLQRGRQAEAEGVLQQAYALARSLPEGALDGELWWMTARVADQGRRWVTAYTAWRKALAARPGREDWAAWCWLQLGETQLRAGDHGAATTSLLTAMERLPEEDFAFLGRWSVARARLRTATGELGRAWVNWCRAESALEQADLPRLLAVTRLRMASFALAHRSEQEGVSLMRRALLRGDSEVRQLAARLLARHALRTERFGIALLAARVEESCARSLATARGLQVRALDGLCEDAAIWMAAYEERLRDGAPGRAVAQLTELDEEASSWSLPRLAGASLARRDRVLQRWAERVGVSLARLLDNQGLLALLDALDERAPFTR